MLFLVSAVVFAALVLAFNLTLRYTRRHPDALAGDWLAMGISIFFTGGFAGAFGAMIATATYIAPSIIVDSAIAVVVAVLIVAAVAVALRSRPTMPGSPVAG